MTNAYKSNFIWLPFPFHRPYIDSKRYTAYIQGGFMHCNCQAQRKFHLNAYDAQGCRNASIVKESTNLIGERWNYEANIT